MYVENNSLVLFIADSKLVMQSPVSIPLSLRNVITFSVGILPTRASLAIGHPPKPYIAPSKRRHPASNAALSFSYPLLGWV